MEQNRVHFIDADPKHLSLWLGYFRTRKVPYVEAGSRRQRLIAESEEAGLTDLADELHRLVDWRRADLQRLLVHRGAVLHGARLHGQDLSRLGFGGCCLRRADLRDFILIQCDFEGASMEDAKLEGADMSDCNLSGANLGRADLRKANLSNAMLKDAILPAWNSGLLEGVRLTGATGWMPANKDLSNAKLQGADLSSCDLSGVDLSSADFSGANLSNADMKSVNLTNAKLQGAHLPAWSSGLLEGVKLAGAEGWVPADKDLSNAKLKGADLSNAKLQGTVLKGADLSKCDLSGADLTGADLSEANLQGTNFRDARGDRPATTLPVTCPVGKLSSSLKVGKPVVFALTAPRALTLQRVTLCNDYGDGQDDQYCPKQMEVQTGPSATGPWTSVVKFTSRQTKQEQTFAAAPDAPLLAGFVQVLVHDTYGGQANVKRMALEGEGWG
jgi:uncharacterized protein YjbI with pentapeptide repeats